MKLTTLIASVVLLSVPSVRAEETVESVEAQILAKSKELKSLTADMKSTTSMEMPGYAMHSTVEGSYQMVINDGKTCYRQESSSVSETDIGGQKTRTESESLALSDGSTMYTVTAAETGTTAMRMKAQAAADMKPFDGMRSTYSLKVLPEETVAGRDCFVIEGSPKDPSMAAVMGKSVSYYDKDTGFMMKMIAYSPDGKPSSVTEYTNVKFNPDVDASLFRWDPALAKGAEVQDMGG